MEPQQPLVLNCVHWHSTYWQVGRMPSNVDEHWEPLDQHKVLILIVTKRTCTCASNMWLLLQSYNSSFKLNFQINSPLNFLKSFLFVCILPHNQWLMYNLKIFALSLWKWFLTHLWPSLEAGHNREHCTLRAIRDRLSFSSPPPPPAKLLDTVLCCNVSQEHTRTSSWPAQSNAVASLTGNVHHLLCHAWAPVANTDGRILWPSPLSTRPLHMRTRDRDDFEGAEEHHFTHTAFYCFF